MTVVCYFHGTAGMGGTGGTGGTGGRGGRGGRGGGQPAVEWDPDRYRRWAAFVPEYGREVIELLEPRPGERVLDLGCGDGSLSLQLERRGCTVVGVDQSPRFVAAARARGVRAFAVDARDLIGPELLAGSFDAVFSNAVLHWIPQAAPVIAGVHRLLRRGGRFVAECGGAGNVATVHGALYRALRRRGLNPAAHDPWYFPTVDEYRTLLERHGLVVPEIRLFPRLTPIPGTLKEWLATFATPFVGHLDAATADAISAEVVAASAPRLRVANGSWTVDYVRLRFRAFKWAGRCAGY